MRMAAMTSTAGLPPPRSGGCIAESLKYAFGETRPDRGDGLAWRRRFVRRAALRTGERGVKLDRDGVVWCLGMYASGSTWLFNALLKVAAAIAPDLPRASRFVASQGDVGVLRGERRLLLVKSHETDEPAAARLLAEADLVFISIRDPRDGVASVMDYQKRDFAMGLDLTEKAARLCQRLVADKRSLLLRYEAGFVDDPTTLDRLAARLGRALPPGERARIFAETRRPAVERFIAGMDKLPGVLWHPPTGDRLDPVTHWHSHHANRTGEIGRWRRVLTAEQARAVNERMADWMTAFTYRV
jgi:hypothetical protein